jgi:anti-anti-sigma factor
LLDAYSEQAFLKALEKFVEESPKNFVLDLSQIDFVDSSGIGALVKIAKKVQNAGGTFQTVTNPRVTQTVKLVRLEQFLSLQPSVDDALAKLKQN